MGCLAPGYYCVLQCIAVYCSVLHSVVLKSFGEIKVETVTKFTHTKI